jgi:hypothetical protein
MTQITPISSSALPALVAAVGEADVGLPGGKSLLGSFVGIAP